LNRAVISHLKRFLITAITGVVDGVIGGYGVAVHFSEELFEFIGGQGSMLVDG
jgi:hypothetical protein